MTPYTVILLLPEDERDPAYSASDWVERVYVTCDDPDDAFAIAMNDTAAAQGRAPQDYDVVAVYEGHIFDLFQP